MTNTAKRKPLPNCYSIREIAQAESIVDQAFNTATDRDDKTRRNPFTGASWMPGDDPLTPQKDIAVRAVLARQQFAKNGPRDLQPLPLGYDEREKRKGSGTAKYLSALYARSLENLNYDVGTHPSFDDYACGAMASKHTPDFIRNDKELQRQFPPRPLDGLSSGVYWLPPKNKSK